MSLSFAFLATGQCSFCVGWQLPCHLLLAGRSGMWLDSSITEEGMKKQHWACGLVMTIATESGAPVASHALLSTMLAMSIPLEF